MTHAGYVAAGYAVTVAGLVAYVASLRRRERRARRVLEEQEKARL